MGSYVATSNQQNNVCNFSFAKCLRVCFHLLPIVRSCPSDSVFCVGGQAAHTFCYLCNLQSSNSFSSNVNVISFSYSMLIVLSGWMEYECKPLHLDLPSNLLQLPLWIFLFLELWISRSNAKRFFPRGQFDCNSLWTFSQPWLSYNKRFLHHRFHRCQYSQELLGLFLAFGSQGSVK